MDVRLRRQRGPEGCHYEVLARDTGELLGRVKYIKRKRHWGWQRPEEDHWWRFVAIGANCQSNAVAELLEDTGGGASERPRLLPHSAGNPGGLGACIRSYQAGRTTPITRKSPACSGTSEPGLTMIKSEKKNEQEKQEEQ